MREEQNVLPQESCLAILNEIAPGSTLSTVHPMGNEGTHSAYAIDAYAASGEEIRLAVKCYRNDVGPGDARARLEFKTLALLQQHAVPVPAPLYLDEHGMLLGCPAIVTQYVAGKQMLTSPDGLECARELARTLVKIHSIPYGQAEKLYLVDANKEYLWFMQSGVIPDYMVKHPDGTIVWNAIQELVQTIEPVPPAFVHTDYWMGNVLWEQNRITAVLDWEEAGYGDPAYDVAYCRMDMYLSRMGSQAADEFLNVYEAEMGRPVANLDLWEFAVTPRPMYVPDWEPLCRQELREFIGDIRRRTGY